MCACVCVCMCMCVHVCALIVWRSSPVGLDAGVYAYRPSYGHVAAADREHSQAVRTAAHVSSTARCIEALAAVVVPKIHTMR